MEYRQLGRHGLSVSSIGLGTRTWGLDTDPHEAAEVLDAFLQAGGSLLQVETDPRHPEPVAVVGELLSGAFSRDAVTLAVRSGHFPAERPADKAAQTTALGRGPLLDALDRSLRALHTDHVDLWTVTGPLAAVPLEETIGALEFAVRSGRARYVGIGNVGWWNGGAAVTMATHGGFALSAWETPVSLLNTTTLTAEASELRQAGLGILAAAPLAGGVLTGKYRHTTPPDSRATSPRFRAEIEHYLQRKQSGTRSVVEGLVRAAEGLDRSAGQVALAWCRSVSGVSSAVIGPRTVRQTTHLLEAADWRLPPALNDVLTEVALGR